MRQCVSAVEGCRARTQCEERCEDGEQMCSPLHHRHVHRLPRDTTQQHQTHHGYSYPSYSHLSSHWVRALQPSTADTHCPTASYPLQHSTVYSSAAVLQSTTSTPDCLIFSISSFLFKRDTVTLSLSVCDIESVALRLYPRLGLGPVVTDCCACG